MADFGLKADVSTENTATAGKPGLPMDLIAAVKPRAVGRAVVDIAESDRAAASLGFVSREAGQPVESTTRVLRKRRAPEDTSPLALRLRVSVHKRFLDYADKHGGLSYPAALERLLTESEALERIQGQK
jgi:hypothetical protein